MGAGPNDIEKAFPIEAIFPDPVPLAPWIAPIRFRGYHLPYKPLR